MGLLEGIPTSDSLAAALIAANAIPVSEPRDALYIAIAATQYPIIRIHLHSFTMARKLSDFSSACTLPSTIATMLCKELRIDVNE